MVEGVNRHQSQRKFLGRGWDALADALAARSQPKEGKSTPTERLVAMAWGYWVERLTHPTAVTQLLDEAAAGDPKATASLLPLVYDELRKLAALCLPGTATPCCLWAA